MAGSPIFSVNFTNRKISAVLNYHKSCSWSNQPVLWDFEIMFLLVLSLWMFVTIFCPKHGVTGDVWRHNILTFHAASAENQQEKSLRVSSLLELKYTSTVSCRRYDETKKVFVRGNLNFALMYRNNIEFSVFVLCHWVDCEIYWEYRTAGHLVFWKLWPAVELKKVSSVTKHGFVFWAQRKPNTRLEIYKAFQDRLTCLNRHMIV